MATPYLNGTALDFQKMQQDLYYIIPVVIFASTQPDKSKVYERIVHHAKKVQQGAPGEPKDRYRAFEFISFNWDTLLENEIRRAGLVPHYFPGLRSPGLKISVLKPHGSLETVVCVNPACPRSKADWPTRIPRGLDVYGNKNWIPDPCPVCKQATLLVLVPPHLVKSAPAPARKWTNAVFVQMYSAIKYATKLTIVGYSLPATDYTFRLIFRTALAARQNLREVVVVSRPKTWERRQEFELSYRGLFKSAGFDPDKVQFDYSGVEDWSRTL
jgi:hypothetical protein